MGRQHYQPSAVAREAQRLADEVAGRRMRGDRRVERIALGIGGFGGLAVALATAAVVLLIGGAANAKFWAMVVALTVSSIGMLVKVFRAPPPPRVETPPPPRPVVPAAPRPEAPQKITRWTD